MVTIAGTQYTAAKAAFLGGILFVATLLLADTAYAQQYAFLLDGRSVPQRLTAFNTATRSTEWTVSLGRGCDCVYQEMQMARGNELLYVANYYDSTISVVSVERHAVVRTVSLPSTPLSIALNRSGSVLYVLTFDAVNGYAVHSLTTSSWQREMIGAHLLPQATQLAVSFDGTKVYVPAYTGASTTGAQNYLAVLRVAATGPATVSYVAVGNNTTRMAMSGDGSRLYLGHYQDGTVTVINTQNDQVVRTVPIGQAVMDLQVSPDGSQLWVLYSDGFALVDRATNAVVRRLSKAGEAYFGFIGAGQQLLTLPGRTIVDVTTGQVTPLTLPYYLKILVATIGAGPQLRITPVNASAAALLEPSVPAYDPATRSDNVKNVPRSTLQMRVGCYNGSANVPCRWSLSVERKEQDPQTVLADSGHLPDGQSLQLHVGLPGAGTVAPAVCELEAGCPESVVTFTADQIAGTVQVGGTCEGGACVAATPLELRPSIRGLVDVRGSAGLWIMKDRSHAGSNSYVTPAVAAALQRVASCWRLQNCLENGPRPAMRRGVNDLLYLTDASLRDGGKFDLGGTWTQKRGEHFSHHEGRAVDLRLQVTTNPDSEETPSAVGPLFSDDGTLRSEQGYLAKMLRMQHFVMNNTGEKPGSIDLRNPHWHALLTEPAAPARRPRPALSLDAMCTPRATVSASVTALVPGRYRYTYDLRNTSATAVMESLYLNLPAGASRLPADNWYWGTPWSGGARLIPGGAGLGPNQTLRFSVESDLAPGRIAYELRWEPTPTDQDPDGATDALNPCDSTAGVVVGPSNAAPEAVEDLAVHAIRGSDVTLRWRSAFLGSTPSSYILEGGLAPGQTVASIRTSGADTFMTLALPPGTFFVRVRGASGTQVGPVSNEVRLTIGSASRPAAPTSLVATMEGHTLRLQWKPSYEAGIPTSMVLDATGTLSGRLPLGLTSEFVVGPVPSGTYALSVLAANAAGISTPSSTVRIAVPSACRAAPEAPDWFGAQLEGNRLNLRWEPPTGGDATASYRLDVSGALTTTLPLTGGSIGGALPTGTYTFTLRGVNACGTSTAAEYVTVIVP